MSPADAPQDPDQPASPSDAGDPLAPWRRRADELLARLDPDGAARYALGETLGEGMTGLVRSARDGLLGRTVAVKILRDGGAERDPSQGSGELVRFLEEAQVTGRLDHPGVVPVHDLVRGADGQIFFTMRQIPGQDLRGVIEAVHRGDPSWTLPRALAALLKVCDTMAYAHSRGVVHRDLKPANIMVGEFGEVYVMDWGLALMEGRDPLASWLDELPEVLAEEADGSGRASSQLTLDGAVVGTPAYMAPEQARGEREALGPWSDVYAMGALLYHLVSGGAPYLHGGQRLSALSLVRKVREGPPPALEQVSREVPSALAAICARAMARDPADRYAHMGELRADLSAYLEGRVVRAHRTGPGAELASWVRRNRITAAALGALVLVALLGSGALAWIQSRAAEDERRLAQERDRERLAAVAARDAEVVARQAAQASQAEAERLRGQAERRRQEAEQARAVALAETAEAESQRRTAERVATLLEDLFAQAAPGFSGDREPTLAEVLDLAERQVALLGPEEAVVQGRLLASLAASQAALGRLDRAEALFGGAAAGLERELGGDHPEVLDARVQRAALDIDRGRAEQAAVALRELLTRADESLGADHEVSLLARRFLAAAHQSQGRWSDAEELLRAALAAQQDAGGPWSRQLLTVQQELANLHLARGRPELAEPLLEECLALGRVLQGPFSADVLSCSNSLAVLAYGEGRLGQARERFEECLEVATRLYDRRHPRVLSVKNNLAAVLLGLQRFDEAAPLFREVLEDRREVLGPEHPETLQSLNNLAALEFSRGRVDEALALHRDALAAMEARLGVRHPETLVALDNLVKMLASQRRWEEAEARCTELVERTEESDGRLAERRQLLDDLRRQLDWMAEQRP